MTNEEQAKQPYFNLCVTRGDDGDAVRRFDYEVEAIDSAKEAMARISSIESLRGVRCSVAIKQVAFGKRSHAKVRYLWTWDGAAWTQHEPATRTRPSKAESLCFAFSRALPTATDW